MQQPEFLSSRETPNLRATWLGHACYYVEFPNGLRVLFDPVFEDRCSPFTWLGPKRYTDPPCKISDIPTIDAVVISHSHYDHLSHPTVKEIAQRHPNCHFFAPLGNKQWFTQSGINNMTELDWWDERDITLSPSATPTEVHETDGASKSADIKARINCLPCQHASGRSAFDQSTTLWASWSIEAGGRKVYFAGYVIIWYHSSDQQLSLTGTRATEQSLTFQMTSTTTHRSTTFLFVPRSNRWAGSEGLLTWA